MSRRRNGAQIQASQSNMLPSRNEVLGFAQRTRKNLEFIEDAYDGKSDVHVVTQLALSLLGLIVFPWERHCAERVKRLGIDDLKDDGWPAWDIYLGESKYLGEIIYHLRNAVAHGRLVFSSDSRDPNDITIDVADHKPKSHVPYWLARIRAPELRQFCLRFIRLIEETVG
jgi:hypothetical protein